MGQFRRRFVMNVATKLFTAGSLVLAVLALGACATQPTEVAQKPEDAKAGCVRETGTHIERKEGKKEDCVGPGRTYTREDLERTGGVTTSDALRRAGVR
jgi:hypothetical protein